jgi:hypothetical protein
MLDRLPLAAKKTGKDGRNRETHGRAQCERTGGEADRAREKPARMTGTARPV